MLGLGVGKEMQKAGWEERGGHPAACHRPVDPLSRPLTLLESCLFSQLPYSNLSFNKT